MPGKQRKPGAPGTSDDSMNSALNLWQEAVEKAGVDLERIVNSTVEQLSRYSDELEKSFISQLAKLEQQSTLAVGRNAEELAVKSDELLEQILECRRREVDKILESAHAARLEVRALLLKSKREILEEFNSRLKELYGRIQDPRGEFASIVQRQRASLVEQSRSGLEKTETRRKQLEDGLDEKALECEREIDTEIGNLRRQVDSRIYDYGTQLDSKIKDVVDQLAEISQSTQSSIAEATKAGLESVQVSQAANGGFVSTQIEEWTRTVEGMRDDFQEKLKATKEESFENHTRSLHMEVSEGKAAMSHLAADARSRLQGNHETYATGLRRLERRYEEELNKLLLRLEAVIAEEHDFPQSGHDPENDQELRKKLRNSLEARGSELVKNFKRQGEVIESDFARVTSSCTERLESIRAQSIDSLEKQVRMINSDLERVKRSFSGQLSQVSMDLPEIEERGHVAALSVSAYLASMLTLETDDFE